MNCQLAVQMLSPGTLIQSGTAIGLAKDGTVRRFSAGDRFCGFAESGRTPDDPRHDFRVAIEGTIELPIAGATQSDFGKKVFIKNSVEFTLEGSGATEIGHIVSTAYPGRPTVKFQFQKA